MKKIFGAALLLITSPVFAQDSGLTSSSTTFNAFVETVCEISSTSSIDFGSYDPIGVNATLASRSSGNIGVRCSNGATGVTVSLSEGNNPASNSSCAAPIRRLRSSSGQYITYQIFQNKSENIVWGCAPTTSKELEPFTTLNEINVPTYGVIPQSQDVALGTYLDIVEVSVTF